MDHSSSQPGLPGAAPLQPISPDRVNHQRENENPMLSSVRTSHRDSDVLDKIRQFNHLSSVSMSKQLERKTADAALKRAMLGREEAESEMRRYRDEARALRRQVDDGRERERKVGERLETVMESYGRAKETYSHTQAIWEKEIRRARKETFKSQSSIVKLQEEVKVARASSKSIEERLEREKELSKTREQEAFASRYQLVGLQEQLEKALERIKFVEEERDAFKAAAQSEEVARIAAEGRLPLPPEEPNTEFASPKKPRVSLSTMDIVSSAASEDEIDELTRLWQWERRRADRTQEHLEFVQAECQMSCCAGSRSRRPRRSTVASVRKERPGPIAIVDPADLIILGKKPESPAPSPVAAQDSRQSPADTAQAESAELVEPVEGLGAPEPTEPNETAVEEVSKQEEAQEQKGPRRGTVFLPSEGTFRTLSQHELEAMEKIEESAPGPLTPVSSHPNPDYYSRTPSVDPPTFALMVQERTSLLSLLNAPRESDSHCTVIDTTATPGDDPSCDTDTDAGEEADEPEVESPASSVRPDSETAETRPHTSAAFYTVTTTTSIPIRDVKIDPHTIAVIPAHHHGPRVPSFDVNNPALTPTMTREQALAQIKERRGRARSAAQGAMTPRKQMMGGVGVERRDVSAPAGRAAKGRT
ncbi:Uu.00g070440.m01.CDS01 [Anthostomella pinea]|uniref:Uu.00g070440.m01.CDS01 n=1 Tax=Anthostomella pinea TaxID=933095 RepID=A0AAI8YNJ3_9PEZI|nr:Uu.00g070440.m01.CDS01 [Anthostomella pinea]